jgi:cobalamin biosynthetic protein CobC
MAEPAALAGMPEHGGDLAFATARYGTPAEGWLDLSTGISPLPYPLAPSHPHDAARLPEPAALAGLIAAARAAYGVPAGTGIVAAPGSEIAIGLLPLAAPAGSVAIVAPTYGSHARTWQAAGRTVVEVTALASVPENAAVVVVGNPNNPDGRAYDPVALGVFARGRNGLLIVDEAFADTAPHLSLVPHLSSLPAVVLRSFGKFYGLAGLRLGFAIGAPAITGRLAGVLGAWPVSGPALATATRALTDAKWAAATRTTLGERMQRLRAMLARAGLTATGGTSLFTLVADDDAAAVHAFLAERGIWTRIFAADPRWLRIGLPPDAGFARLERALSALPR